MTPENIYEYSADDFEENEEKHTDDKSKFDVYLCNAWDTAMKNDAFWYNLDEVARKSIPGKYQMTAQLNKKRFAQRRKPEEAKQVVMPFNPDKFNFNKIKESEVLFKLKRTDIQEERVDKIIINVSPIEYGHTLLVPNVEKCSPQILDEHAIEIAVEICLLSNRGLRFGFNSLCALASVNHQHFHVFYYHPQLPVDVAKAKQVTSSLYCLDDYMVNGYVLQLVEKDIKKFSNDVLKITSYLCDKNIAHNLAICKRSSIQSNASLRKFVTVFIFPKKPSPGKKETQYMNSCCFDLAGYLLFKELTNDSFNTASLECAGFLPIRDEKEYEGMREENVVDILNKYCYQDDDFKLLSDELIKTML